MHDPMTQAHVVPNPFRWWWRPWPKWTYDKDYASLPRNQRKHARRRVRRWDQLTKEEQKGRSSMYRRGKHAPLFEIWHRDPERHGDDDSCGWFAPSLTDEQRERLKNLAWHEAYDPHFFASPMEKIDTPLSESLAAGRVLIFMVARALKLKVSSGQVERWACEWFCEQRDSMGNQLCYKPVYHDNLAKPYEKETAESFNKRRREARQEWVAGFYCRIATLILRELRPWYRHPRWHVWHWELRVDFLLHFKRWAFSRCQGCGGRFPWGYAPVSGDWNSRGPGWFRNRERVWHHECHSRAICVPVECVETVSREEYLQRINEADMQAMAKAVVGGGYYECAMKKDRDGEIQERVVTGYEHTTRTAEVLERPDNAHPGVRAGGFMETPPKAPDAPRASDGPPNGPLAEGQP